MNPRLRRLLFWVALPGLLVALAVWSWTPREPSWEGRSLSSWLKDLEPDRKEKLGAVGEQNAAAARRAIQGMGTNCLPFLLRRIESQDPTPPEKMLLKLEELLGKNSAYLLGERSEVRNGAHFYAAYYAFTALGHQAAPVVPECQRWLCSTNANRDALAVGVLESIHPEGTAALIVASTNSTLPRRRFVMGALLRLAPEHPEAFAALLRLDADPDPKIRALAGHVLAVGRYEAAVIWPVLNRLLADPDDSVRRAILRDLDSFKGDLSPAVPALTALTTDPDPEISSKANALLLKIKAHSTPTAVPAPPP